MKGELINTDLKRCVVLLSGFLLTLLAGDASCQTADHAFLLHADNNGLASAYSYYQIDKKHFRIGIAFGAVLMLIIVLLLLRLSGSRFR